MKETVQHAPSCNDDFDPSSISVDAARSHIQKNITPITGTEKLAIRSCLNRVLAADIQSPVQVPAHTNSAMDGYAIAGTDLPTENARKYKVIGTAFAGIPYTGNCQPGQVVRIMTGAAIPEGCDTVIMQEHIEILDDEHIAVGSGHKSGQNVRYAGEDIEVGSTVLTHGKRIMPADLGVLASLGIGEAKAYRRPRVAFFSTGDELCSIGEMLGEGQIYDSNRYSLYGMLKTMHVDILDLGVIRDTPDSIREAMLSAAAMADVIITSGGVSVGEADHIKPILESLGAMHFWKVAMKPGRPLTFGKINNSHFFGLPGNPVSAMVTFYQFIQPALHTLSNAQPQPPVTLRATCTTTLKKRPGRCEFQRGIYQQAADGTLTVGKTGEQGSGILTSMSQANCFIILPVESSGAEVGEQVEIQLFDTL